MTPYEIADDGWKSYDLAIAEKRKELLLNMPMKQLVCGRDAEICDWVAARIPESDYRAFDGDHAIGVESDGRLIAGVVYSDYKPQCQTIQLSMAADSPMWASRDVIAGLLHYPFEQLGVYKLWTATAIENAAALKVNYHIGFKREAVLAHHFGRKRHMVICRMLKPDYQRKYHG